jgi:hypothetical protein
LDLIILPNYNLDTAWSNTFASSFLPEDGTIKGYNETLPSWFSAGAIGGLASWTYQQIT